MAKWYVYGTVTIGVTMEVEADSKEDALDKASDEYPGLSGYCGNGRTGGALIGTSDDALTLEAGEDTPEWTEAEPA